MSPKKWILPPPIPREKIDAFSRQLGILPITASILIHRGLGELESAQMFMKPSGLRLLDYRELPGSEEAGALLAHAITQREHVTITGDYDVDGITSAALMTEFIRSRGGSCSVMLPDRVSEGYGLSQAFVNEAVVQGSRLLLTVDCGITACSEIAFARQHGLTVVVTDHHEPGSELPEADVIVNPKVTGPKRLHILAGVGVALQVVRAASAALGEKDPEVLRRHLDLVALGTVADVVPLIGENRSLTRAGLAVINRGAREGLRALIRSASLEQEQINSTHLAFRLAPRLNAAGRVGDARYSFDLLLSTDALEAETLAQHLNQENVKRQVLERSILLEAEKRLQLDGDLPLVNVISGPHWPLGVLGLVASKLTEKYHRPCFILSEMDGIVRGSGRSIPGFSLCAALKQVSGILLKWGGHEMAAGITLVKEQLAGFTLQMQQIARERLQEEDLLPSLKIDAQDKLLSINQRLLKEIKCLEPFGYGNARPLLAIPAIHLAKPPRIVGERHLKLKLSDGDNYTLDAIGFGMANRIEELNLHTILDIAGHPSENMWNGTTSIQMEIKDFHLRA